MTVIGGCSPQVVSGLNGRLHFNESEYEVFASTEFAECLQPNEIAKLFERFERRCVDSGHTLHSIVFRPLQPFVVLQRIVD